MAKRTGATTSTKKVASPTQPPALAAQNPVEATDLDLQDMWGVHVSAQPSPNGADEDVDAAWGGASFEGEQEITV